MQQRCCSSIATEAGRTAAVVPVEQASLVVNVGSARSVLVRGGAAVCGVDRWSAT